MALRHDARLGKPGFVAGAEAGQQANLVGRKAKVPAPTDEGQTDDILGLTAPLVPVAVPGGGKEADLRAMAAGLGGYVFYPLHRRPPNRHGSQRTARAHKTRAATPGLSTSRLIRLPDPSKVAFQACSGRMALMQNIAIALVAALLELTGYFAVWEWYRLDKGAVWLAPVARRWRAGPMRSMASASWHRWSGYGSSKATGPRPLGRGRGGGRPRWRGDPLLSPRGG